MTKICSIHIANPSLVGLNTQHLLSIVVHVYILCGHGGEGRGGGRIKQKESVLVLFKECTPYYAQVAFCVLTIARVSWFFVNIATAHAHAVWVWDFVQFANRESCWLLTVCTTISVYILWYKCVCGRCVCECVCVRHVLCMCMCMCMYCASVLSRWCYVNVSSAYCLCVGIPLPYLSRASMCSGTGGVLYRMGVPLL